MDIVLEVVDTYALDYLYSAILPAHPAPYDLKHGASNATLDFKASSTWQYTPSTKFITLEPSEAAYMSQWTRDNAYRQLITLFFITWSVARDSYRALY